jgi:adenylate kinase family enzyme
MSSATADTTTMAAPTLTAMPPRITGDAPGLHAVVAITGPSCVGKRTLASLLPTDRVHVVDLQVIARERAAAGSAAGHSIAGLPSPRVYPAPAVYQLLRDAVMHAMMPILGRTVVLPGLPATVEQVHLLSKLGRALGVPGAVVELQAPDLSLQARRQRRRTCLRCCPDPGGEPHTVAPPGDERYIIDVSDDRLPDTCTECRARLFVRARDNPQAFHRRVHAYRTVAPALRHAALASGLGWYAIATSRNASKELYEDPQYDGVAELRATLDTRTQVATNVETALTAARLLPLRAPSHLAAAAPTGG